MLAHATAMPTLPAHDLERAVAFYRDTLGLTPTRATAGGVLFAAGGGHFFLYETASAGTARNTAMSFVVDDLPAEVEALRRKGVTFEEYDFPGLKTVNGIAELEGELSAWFIDPEGNIIAVSQWTS
jgi:catechol 2,3-dioxygenase-like lactoylglutathione lyase family enzyme